MHGQREMDDCRGMIAIYTRLGFSLAEAIKEWKLFRRQSKELTVHFGRKDSRGEYAPRTICGRQSYAFRTGVNISDNPTQTKCLVCRRTNTWKLAMSVHFHNEDHNGKQHKDDRD